jgi:HemY protein
MAAKGGVGGLAAGALISMLTSKFGGGEQAALDPRQLQRAWLSLEEAERRMPEVAVQAASHLMDLGGEPVQARQWLLAAWEQMVQPEASASQELQVRLVTTLERSLESIDGEWLARMEAALISRPRDANFQYLAGMACLSRQLWGKAQQLLSHAVLHLSDTGLKRRAWRANWLPAPRWSA